MKANPDKFQFIILRNTDSHTLKIGDITTKSVLSLTLLGITIGLKLINDRKSICLLPINLDVLFKIDMQRVEKVQ